MSCGFVQYLYTSHTVKIDTYTFNWYNKEGRNFTPEPFKVVVLLYIGHLRPTDKDKVIQLA